jgi:ribokinase
MLQKIFSKFGDRVKLRVEHGRHGRTTGLEFVKSNATKANVMLNDAGDNEYFGSEKIASDENLKILENANAVTVVNWGSNLKGSELATFAFNKSAKSFHYLDPADIESRKDEFRDFLRTISSDIHVLALNENEANSLGNSLGMNSLLPANDYDEADVKNAALEISSNLGINTDIHTRIGAASSNTKKVDFVPAFEVKAKTLTGAGDSWDSANLVCHLSEISTYERLMFSNAYASLYVGNSQAEHPTMGETLEFLKRV